MKGKTIKFLPERLKQFLKSFDAIVALNDRILPLRRKLNWQIHLLKDFWGTRIWKRTTEVSTPLGFKLISGFHPAYELMRRGKFEVNEVAIIERILPKADVFIDVGANLGYYTCLASKYNKHVIAFEPQQQNLQCLMQNLVGNGYEQLVEIFPLALGAHPGLLNLYGASGPSASFVKDWAGYSSRFKQLIPVSTLDFVLGPRFADKQLIVKIDVEGAEYKVLQGAVLTISREKKPVWLLEVCLREFHPNGANPDYREIFELFWSNGYVCYTASEKPHLVESKDVDEWLAGGNNRYEGFNYVFLSREMAKDAQFVN